MAANAAASVVWLTTMTFDSDLGADLGTALAGLFASLVEAGFDSVFLFVTDAFNFSGAGLAAARDEGFAFDEPAFATVFGAALATVFFTAMLDVFALPADLAATGFLTAGFAVVDLPALVAVEFAFFAGAVVFAVFFIAFAMESIPNGLLSFAPSELRLVEPFRLDRLGIRPRDTYFFIAIVKSDG